MSVFYQPQLTVVLYHEPAFLVCLLLGGQCGAFQTLIRDMECKGDTLPNTTLPTSFSCGKKL